MIQAKIKLFERLGKLSDALEHSKQLAEHASVRYSKDAASRVSVIEAAFQNERNQREIEALTADNKIKQLEVEQQKRKNAESLERLPPRFLGRTIFYNISLIRLLVVMI